MNKAQQPTNEFIDLNGVRHHYLRAGDGPLIVFLHGFPQSSYEWRHQIPDFARDHLVVAPDLVGYNLSEQPAELWRYGVWPQVESIRALADELGHEKFTFIGHDWGAAAAWSFAMHYPERLERLVILSTAHPMLFERELREREEQQQASGYFLLCRGPEGASVLSQNDFALLRAQLEFPFISEDDLESYLEGWRRPAALEGMLSWYRREGLGPPDELHLSRGNYVPEISRQLVEVPTLVLYGDGDIYTLPGCHAGLDAYVPELVFRNFEGASHWLAEELPDRVNGEIRQFIGRSAPADAAAAA